MCSNEGGSDPEELWEKKNGSVKCVLGIYVLIKHVKYYP